MALKILTLVFNISKVFTDKYLDNYGSIFLFGIILYLFLNETDIRN